MNPDAEPVEEPGAVLEEDPGLGHAVEDPGVGPEVDPGADTGWHPF